MTRGTPAGPTLVAQTDAAPQPSLLSSLGNLDPKTPQRLLSRRVDESRLHVLEQVATDDRFCTILQSVRLKGTGAFLNVIPSPALGLYIPPREFTAAIKYRLGLPLYPAPGPCALCQKDSDIYGDHAISACIVGGDRTRRHDKIVDVIYEKAKAAVLYPRKEERNLLDDLSRPGDISIECPWPHARGKAKVAFDVTVASPLRQDSRHLTLHNPSAVLEKARIGKFRKYGDKIPPEIALVPLAVTTFGAWEENAVINLKEISKQQAANQRIDGGKLLCHFFERLSVVLQRENGAMLIERSPLNNLPGHVDGAL